jgi:hypothetical protein
MSLHNQIRRGLVSIASFAVLATLVVANGEPVSHEQDYAANATADAEALAQCPVIEPGVVPAHVDAGDDDDTHAGARPNWRTLLPTAILRTRS